MKKLLSVILVGVIALSVCGCGNNKMQKEEKRNMTYGPVYDEVLFNDNLWQAPEYEVDESLSISDKIKGIWYTTYCNGEETKAFAYLGIPKNSEGKKLPAILLVHGGGGTAYHEWVGNWVKKGYVALAPDLEGHVPLMTGNINSYPDELYKKSDYISYSNQNYNDASKPIEQTWMYYATSTAILGNSLLHSLDAVDKYKIGVCGVSWGGIITSIITGYDDRFAFSIPIYCSLNIAETGGFLGSYYKNNPDSLIWDIDEGLSQRETPVLIVAADTDSGNSSSALSNSLTISHSKNGRLLLINGLLHSHYHAVSLIEPYSFADSIVKGEREFSKVTKQPDTSNTEITVDCKDIEEGILWYTEDEIIKDKPTWLPVRCTVKGKTCSAPIPERAKYFYYYIDDGYMGVCSEVIKTK